MPNTVEDIVLTQTPAPMTATAPGGHTCGNTPFSPRVQDLVLEFKKGIKLVLEPFAELKDNKQWDSVHWTLKAHQTACYHQDVDAFLHLSYVPNTAEDTVLFEEKQKYMYLVQASCRKKSLHINQGAIGGITGIDTRVIEHHPCQTVDLCGIDNHEITSIPIVTAGAVARSQQGGVILIMPQYAYHLQQGRSIHSSCQLESFANDGNNKLNHDIPQGPQQIQTVDSYVFSLSIRADCPILA